MEDSAVNPSDKVPVLVKFALYQINAQDSFRMYSMPPRDFMGRECLGAFLR